MDLKEQWNAAWRMARLGRKTGDGCCNSPWLERPEWIWDAFCGRRLREVSSGVQTMRSQEAAVEQLVTRRYALKRSKLPWYTFDEIQWERNHARAFIAEWRQAHEQ